MNPETAATLETAAQAPDTAEEAIKEMVEEAGVESTIKVPDEVDKALEEVNEMEKERVEQAA